MHGCIYAYMSGGRYASMFVYGERHMNKGLSIYVDVRIYMYTRRYIDVSV